MTAPESYKPIINSINDLPAKSDVHVTVHKGMLADVIFQVNDRFIDEITLANKYCNE